MESDLSDIPLSTYESVLGAEIRVNQRATITHEYPGHGTRETAVRIYPALDWHYLSRNRRYIAAWARRTLFSGCKPHPIDAERGLQA